MKFIDLFAGIGGFRYGFEKCGIERSEWKDKARNKKGQCEQHSQGNTRGVAFNCVWSNEWDKYANQIYKKHYGECDTRDIRTVKASEIPDHDLLTAGFPCQAFSVAGKRLGFEDTRGTLFFEIARILKHKRPRLVLLENVKGLLSHEQGKTFQTILGVLSDIGYRVEWQVLNSKNFGVPQNRERVFIIGYFGKRSRPKVFPVGEDGKKSIGELKVIKNSYYDTDRLYSPDGIARATRANAGGKGAKTGLYAIGWSKSVGTHKGKTRNEKRMKFGEFNTLSTGDGCGNKSSQNFVGENTKIRRLTPTECERLQGFPDGWTEGISDTQRYKCLGNAVTTNVITEIGKKLK